MVNPLNHSHSIYWYVFKDVKGNYICRIHCGSLELCGTRLPTFPE